MCLEEGTQIPVTIGQADLGIDGVKINIDGRPVPPPLGENAVHTAQIDQQVGLPHEPLEMSCTRAVFHLTRRVKESPALTEAKPLQKPGRRGNPIVIGWAKLVRERIVGWGIASGIFVEPHLIAKSAETQEVVHGLPDVAAERKPHQIARQHNRLAARCPPSILHLDAS